MLLLLLVCNSVVESISIVCKKIRFQDNHVSSYLLIDDVIMQSMEFGAFCPLVLLSFWLEVGVGHVCFELLLMFGIKIY